MNIFVSNVFFLALVLMHIPYILAISIFNLPSLLIIMLMTSYFLMIVLFFASFGNSLRRINYKLAVSLVIFLVIMLLPMLGDSINGIAVSSKDYLNIATKGLNFLIFYFLVNSANVDSRMVDNFYRSIVAYAVFACIYNLIFNFGSLVSMSSISSGYEVNFKSFFVNRNQFGAFLLLSIVAKCYLFSQRRLGYLDFFVIFLFVINLVLTMSRGSMLGLLLFSLVLCYFNLRNRVVFSILCASGMLAVLPVIFLLINPTLAGFIDRVFLRTEQGTSGRAQVWEHGIQVFINHNFPLGTGYFTGVSIAKEQGLDKSEFHSLYIETLVSGGVLELVFIIILLCAVLFKVKKFTSKVFYQVYLASLLSFLVMSFFESTSLFTLGFVGTLYTLFMVSLPIAVVGARDTGKKNERSFGNSTFLQ